MKIFVCIKRVPSTETKVKVGPGGKALDTTEVEYILNPFDEYAVEEALKIKEAKGEGEVIALCLGPAAGQKVIRTALAMGADRAIHLEDECPDRDGWSTATILANYLKGQEADLIFCGCQGVDLDQGQVGSRLAALLGIGCVSTAISLELGDGKLVAEREIEGGKEKVEATLPAIITAQKGLNEPRYASLKGIMKAKKKPLDTEAFTDPGPGLVVESMELPPARPPGQIVGEGAEAVPALVEKLKNEAKII